MRTVFFGTPEVAVPTLEALVARGHDVALVVTQPDRSAGRSGRPRASPVKQRSLELGLAIRQPETLRDAGIRADIADAASDVLVVVAYGRILPGRVIRSARHGALNVHFSLLPRYRGAAPVQWALACGETLTGVTTMQISPRLDEGDILLQRELAVERDEHAPALARRLATVGADLLIETLSRLEAGTLERRVQDEALASAAPSLCRRDGEVAPDLPAIEIEGRVRGFDPWPGVWLGRRGRRLRLVEARALTARAPADDPGLVLDVAPHGVVVVCGGRSLLQLVRIQPEGRRPMDVRAAVNGRQLLPGDRLEQLPPARD